MMPNFAPERTLSRPLYDALLLQTLSHWLDDQTGVAPRCSLCYTEHSSLHIMLQIGIRRNPGNERQPSLFVGGNPLDVAPSPFEVLQGTSKA